jgi:hypothetical protein
MISPWMSTNGDATHCPHTLRSHEPVRAHRGCTRVAALGGAPTSAHRTCISAPEVTIEIGAGVGWKVNNLEQNANQTNAAIFTRQETKEETLIN